MHELFTRVLNNKDLSKAGDLFSLPDSAIASDLTDVVNAVCCITSSPDYISSDNDQSIVEICISRVTAALCETNAIEEHAEAMVALLESCLNYNLKPSCKNQDPPHAKISADIISCIFLNYCQKDDVMKRVLPVAVKFLHKGNKELSRNMASYLSLAAVHNASLLSKHIQLIIDSIISGNYSLCRILPQIYQVSKEPIHDHAMALVSLLPLCELPDRLALLQLFALIATTLPMLLEASLPQLCEYLSKPSTAWSTLQVFTNLSKKKPHLLIDSVSEIKSTVESHPETLCLAVQVISSVGHISKDKAEDALNFILGYLAQVDGANQSLLLREVTQLCSSYPALCTDRMLAQVWQCSRNAPSSSTIHSLPLSNDHLAIPIQHRTNDKRSSSVAAGVNNHNINNKVITVVKVNSSSDSSNEATLAGGSSNSTNDATVAPQPITRPSSCIQQQIATANKMGCSDAEWLKRQEANRHVITPRLKLGGDSRSTGRLYISAAHRSATNNGNTMNSRAGSVGGGLHKSLARLSTGPPQSTCNCSAGNAKVLMDGSSSHGVSNYTMVSTSGAAALCCGRRIVVTARTSSPPKTIYGSSCRIERESPIGPSRHSTANKYSSCQSDMEGNCPPPPPLPPQTTRTNCHDVADGGSTNQHHNHVATTQQQGQQQQRMSVFEPYPMRDTVQHFCEKHLEKIKAYMDKISSAIPQPAKCTIEERRSRKMVKLHFACQTQGEHCLYSKKTYFIMKTRYPRTWIHLMFLTLQAHSENALSSRHTSVTSLKNCWDILKYDNRTFLTLVTSAFPSAKDQDMLMNELRRSGFCDVFEHCVTSPTLWSCFLCTHPERAVGFLQANQPVIEGQLKEKKGRWKFFKRWRTKYFTLSGAHLSYKQSKEDKEIGGTSIDVNQIQSVKVCRGARNIPKAFEIFTGDQSLILKPPKRGTNAEQWVQCLSIAVAHSHAKEAGPSSGCSATVI